MLSLRAKIFAIVSLIVLFILGVSLFLLYLGKKKAAAPGGGEPLAGGSVTAPANGQAGGPAQAAPSAPKVYSSLEVERAAARQLAKLFVERYQSYSTDSNYQNIREVESLVTPEYWKKISAKINTPPQPPFFGVSTQVVSTRLSSWSAADATIELNSLRTSEQNNQIQRTEQRSVVTLRKLNGNWLVSGYSVVK